MLTVTINPSPSVPNLTVRDPRIRLLQYLSSIRWWDKVSRRNGWDLCIVENSDSLEMLRRNSPPGLRWLQAPRPNNWVVERGKGAGEAMMLLEAIQAWHGYSHLMKVTGRLKVLNVAKLVSRTDGPQSHEILVGPGTEFSRVDTRLFIAPPKAVREWMSTIAPSVRDDYGADFEALSWRWLAEQAQSEWTVKAFHRTPAFVGSSGTTGITFPRWKARGRILVESLLKARIVR